MPENYNTIINALNQFSSAHLSLKRFKTSFFEQFDNFSSSDNSFPILYAIPNDVSFNENINTFSFRVYCLDILQKDRSNESNILNVTLLILRDLTNWLRVDETNNLNILNTPIAIPVNNFLVDFTQGWFIDIEIEASAEINDCSIPFSSNFQFSGITCDYTYISQYLTCETLVNCKSFIDLSASTTGVTASYWTSGSTGLFSIKAINDSGLDATGDYAVAEGNATVAIGYASHAEGDNTTASGFRSHAEGEYTIAIGDASHAEGQITEASGYASHAEGRSTIASGDYSHAEGVNTLASNYASHAEGENTTASGFRSHAEGVDTIAIGQASHAEGRSTTAIGFGSHAEGRSTTASGNNSHAGGYNSVATGIGSFVHGSGSTASGIGTIVLGDGIDGVVDNTTYVDNLNIKTIGVGASITNLGIDVDGNVVVGVTGGGDYWTSGSTGLFSIKAINDSGLDAEGDYSYAEGGATTASGPYSHAEGQYSRAIGDYSHAEGYATIAIGPFSHTEGNATVAIGLASHAEGLVTTASGLASHAEGEETIASGNNSHAGGYNSVASGNSSFVHGEGSTASGNSTIVLGNGITGTTANTVFVPNLNIQQVPVGTSITNLGIDVDGNVIIGTTGGGAFTGGTVTGATNFTNGLTADTISATTASITSFSATTYFSGGTELSIVVENLVSNNPTINLFNYYNFI